MVVVNFILQKKASFFNEFHYLKDFHLHKLFYTLVDGGERMKYIQIIIQILFLFVLFWIGEWIREIFHLMIPGSVIGLVLLFILLISGIVKEKYIRSGANFMMKHLVLFFVPATVGIMDYIDLFK